MKAMRDGWQRKKEAFGKPGTSSSQYGLYVDYVDAANEIITALEEMERNDES